MASNRIQMLGINSGMDTESIVNALLQPYQNKIDVQYKKQTKLEWKQEAWKDLNTKISSFFDNYVSKLKMGTTFKGNKVTNTNESAIKINTSSSVVPTGVHKFEVSQLASTAYMRNDKMTNDTILDTKKLSNANASSMTLGDLGLSETTTFKVARTDSEGNAIEPADTFEVNASMTVEAFKDKLDDFDIELSIDDEKGSFSLKYNGAEMQDKETLKLSIDSSSGSGDTGFLGDIGLSATTFSKTTTEKIGSGLNEFSKTTTLARLGISPGTITLNGTEIQVDSSMKLSELESKLKSVDSGLNVNLDLGQGRFFISTKDSGSEKSIKLSDGEGGNLLAQLGLKHSIDTTSSNYDSATTVGDITSYIYKDGTTVIENNSTGEIEIRGANAKYTYNGMEYESASNNISINNINATLLSITTSGQTVNITSENDPTEVASFVKGFVDAYNTLIEEINSLITTRPSKKYEPLTEAERDEMDEDQIEKWEKLAKQGLFYQDSDLISVRDTMRNILGSSVSGTESKSLYSIGITTGSWSENGKLHFDEEAFAKAYEENSEDVIKLLTGSGSEADARAAYLSKNPDGDYDALSDSEKTKYYTNTKGIATRLYESMNKLIYSSSLNRSYGKIYNDKVITKELSSIEDRIDELQDRYDRMETLYYKRFTAMEKALSSMNTQSSWLTSALG